MSPEEYTKSLAEELYDLTQAEKQIKTMREETKQKFFRMVNELHKDDLLPVRSIEIPDEFFNRTGLFYEDFMQTRFPGWELEHIEKNISQKTTTFILKRHPDFIDQEITAETDVGTIKVSRIVSEYTPEIDWETLIKENPELFDKISKPITSYEVDEDKLARLMEESPEDLAIIERHIRVRKPALKVSARKIDEH